MDLQLKKRNEREDEVRGEKNWKLPFPSFTFPVCRLFVAGNWLFLMLPEDSGDDLMCNVLFGWVLSLVQQYYKGEWDPTDSKDNDGLQ